MLVVYYVRRTRSAYPGYEIQELRRLLNNMSSLRTEEMNFVEDLRLSGGV